MYAFMYVCICNVASTLHTSCQLSLLRKPEPQLNYCDGLVLWFPTALACDPLRTKQ